MLSGSRCGGFFIAHIKRRKRKKETEGGERERGGGRLRDERARTHVERERERETTDRLTVNPSVSPATPSRTDEHRETDVEEYRGW